MAEIGLMGYPEISHSEHFFRFHCHIPPKLPVIVTLHTTQTRFHEKRDTGRYIHGDSSDDFRGCRAAFLKAAGRALDGFLADVFGKSEDEAAVY